MCNVTYKNFELTPAPEQLADSGRWTLKVVITKHHDSKNESLTSPYSNENTFETRDEAVGAALDFGKAIIDGHTSLSITNLQ
jgi:hypothetical protein